MNEENILKHLIDQCKGDDGDDDCLLTMDFLDVCLVVLGGIFWRLFDQMSDLVEIASRMSSRIGFLKIS